MTPPVKNERKTPTVENERKTPTVENVKLYLSSKRIYKGKQYYTIPKVECPEYNLEIVGFGFIVKNMCIQLHEAKCSQERLVEVLRGGTTCFTLVPLKQWVFPSDNRPEHLRKPPTAEIG